MSVNTKHFVPTIATVIAIATVVTAGQAPQESSFLSTNFSDRYIRHRSLLGYIEPIDASDGVGRRDATFRLVPGLAGTCQSFESVNYPGSFLRHQNYRLKLSARTEDAVFKKDATFCVRPGLSGASGSRSFESVNFPGHYIRHLNFELWIGRFDDSEQFKKDATFIASPPLTKSRPVGPPQNIDGDNEGRPVQ